jgi:hypothetical protein
MRFSVEVDRNFSPGSRAGEFAGGDGVPRTIVAAGRRWTRSAVVARIASRRAVRALPRAVPDVTGSELQVAGDSVSAGVEEMPDLLRAGLAFALLVTLVVRDRRLFAVGEAERFGRGLALAAVFESRAGDSR